MSQIFLVCSKVLLVCSKFEGAVSGLFDVIDLAVPLWFVSLTCCFNNIYGGLWWFLPFFGDHPGVGLESSFFFL